MSELVRLRGKIYFTKCILCTLAKTSSQIIKQIQKDSLQWKHKYKYDNRMHKRSERFITMLAGRLFLCFRDLRVVVWAELMQRGSVWNLNPLRPTTLTTTITTTFLQPRKKEEKVWNGHNSMIFILTYFILRISLKKGLYDIVVES